MVKSAAEVEREVEATRSDLDRTVEAIREKMTAGQLFDEASRAMGATGQQILSKFAEQAKENPLPLAVMGVGLAWLMTSSNKSAQGLGSSRFLSEPRSFSPSQPGLSDKVHEVRDQVANAASGVQHKLGDALSTASHAGQSAAHSLSAAVGSAAGKTANYGRGAGQTVWAALEREPLLLGGLAVVVGAAIGASLPGTEAEDRIVGEARDRLMEHGKDVVQEGMQKAGQVAQAALDTVKSEAKGLADSSSNAGGATQGVA